MTLQLAYALTTSPVIRQSTFPATGMASPSALLVRITLVLVQLPCRLRPIGPQHPQGVLPFWKIAQADWTTALTVAAVVESEDHPDDHLCFQGIVRRISFLPPSMFNLVCYNLSATTLTMELTDPRKPHHQGVQWAPKVPPFQTSDDFYIANVYISLCFTTCQVPLHRNLPLLAPLGLLLPTITYMLLHIIPIQ